MTVTLSDAQLEAVNVLDSAWSRPNHGARLRAVMTGAQTLREELIRTPAVNAVRTLALTTLAYPTRFAFQGAALSPAPFVSMTHRCTLVQFQQRGQRKTLLFNPTDIQAARRTPFFEQLLQKIGFAESLLTKKFPPLETQLEALGVAPEDIDYVAFDHFHTQDVRSLLGTVDGRLEPRFPNATLIAPSLEWIDWHDLHPMQRAWFVPDGRQGVREDKVVLTQNDLRLGDGVLLLRTPGHTSGNQTLFFKTDQGIWGISENGVCVDNWSARSSTIPGLASTARAYDVDVLLNANTPESGADQLTSMMLERTIVDRVAAAPDFVQMFSSSEATPVLFAPGITPTHLHGEIVHGVVAGSRATPHAPVVSAVDGPPGFGARSPYYR